MQELINMYFYKVCSEKFINNNDELIIGKAEDIVQDLKEQIKYVQKSENKLDESEIEMITDELNELITEIDNKYYNKKDIIGVTLHPMSESYTLLDKEVVYEELKEYYDELEEK